MTQKWCTQNLLLSSSPHSHPSFCTSPLLPLHQKVTHIWFPSRTPQLLRGGLTHVSGVALCGLVLMPLVWGSSQGPILHYPSRSDKGRVFVPSISLLIGGGRSSALSHVHTLHHLGNTHSVWIFFGVLYRRLHRQWRTGGASKDSEFIQMRHEAI